VDVGGAWPEPGSIATRSCHFTPELHHEECR
jgi:hypothetical protein